MKADILIVDDTPANLDLLSNILKENEYKVRALPDGQLAITSAKMKAPDLILLDITMPGLNGFEVCQKLKEDDSLKDIPILFISALTDTDKKVEAFKNGGVDYITKPFQVEEILARVSTHLKIKNLILQQKSHLNELNENYKKLQELENLKDSLVHMIIHDLRSPLFGISAYLELLLGDKSIIDHEENFKFVSMAFQSAKILANMINNLLDVNKLEQNKLKVNKEKCNLKDLVISSYKQLEPLFLQKNLKFISTSNDIDVYCDSNLLSRVIINLITNAIKFSPPNETIETSCNTIHDRIHFEIADKGPGISKENSDKIFNKFFQVDDGSKKDIPSTGLGLTFCKLVIEAHNGEIGIDSELEKGSKFWFNIPIE